MNPIWNPEFHQFMMNNQQRAQAGGNRQFQAVQPQIRQNQVVDRNIQPPRRHNAPAPNQNRRNHQQRHNNMNMPRRGNLNIQRDVMSRDELERIETMTRKNYQTRTAVEYDNRENQCWTNILENIEQQTHQFSHSTSDHNFNGGDIFIPNEESIRSTLRAENQAETILATRDLLLNFGATEQELSGALATLEIHLRTNAAEFNTIDDLSNELIKTAGQLTTEIDELDDILSRIDRLRIQK
ncbi:t-SNARE coiled-coil homology domain-containing protein [Caenorhabditis elegans]|uniref:t-SNARE coiled-coil homology domain-containing protein n=1 Tax=Caenorhabditis elegans TaxID=6239 RepID=Q7YTH3_CAEEL|nr:t-SNARE coiled-coil homology domain-containing protein [Caenorhabditis elegans]CAE18047.1 t-SNARE coiled-coil homology domain-containing protein [Caenorhabditis elegans]|eukprot:NP_001021881.1 Uncharacterized protein CELE_ZK858.8 [Caenorhabditis elegans]